jgi:putative spermidine/putrescine transport system substrate-binding protein
MNFYPAVNRRDFLKATLYAGATLALSGTGLQNAWAAVKGTVNFADIGVGDPGGDWSRFTKQSGWDVNLVAIGNAPSTILNILIAGGGLQTYDVINIVGGM